MTFSFLFATFLFCLQRSFFVSSISVICSRHLLFAMLVCICSLLFFICSVLLLFATYFFYLQRTFFICSVLFLFAAFLFCLQRFFFVCSVSFLFAAFLFCLQRFFFVCSVSLVGHRPLEPDTALGQRPDSSKDKLQINFCCLNAKYYIWL